MKHPYLFAAVIGVVIASLLLAAERKRRGSHSGEIQSFVVISNNTSPSAPFFAPTNGQVVTVAITNTGPPILVTNPWVMPSNTEAAIANLLYDCWDVGAEFGFLLAKRGGTANDLQRIKKAMRARGTRDVERWFEEHK